MSGNTFLKAGVLTLIVFMIGVGIGKYFEDKRLAEVELMLTENDIRLGDLQLQTVYFDTFKNTTNFCESFVEKNLEFGDEVYDWGVKLDKYEQVNKVSPSLTNEKRQYVLFKLQFLLNCIKIKQVCNENYDVLIYFYNTANPTTDQKVEDRVLLDLKQKCGRNLMFIPLPMDTGVGSIDILTAQYGVKKSPTIIINEEIKLEGLQTMDDMGKYLRC